MTMVQPISAVMDRVMVALVSGLEMEFGRDGGAALASRFIDAERTDFCWEARVEERWIGAYESIDEAEIELDQVKILGLLEGQWFVAVMIVDGDGKAQDMPGYRRFGGEQAAREGFADA